MSATTLSLTNERATDDPQRSIDELYDVYAGYVATIVFRLLGRDAEVDDVVQEVFLNALRALKQLRDPQAVKGWLATIAVHSARKRLRTRALRRWFRYDEAPEYQHVAAPEASAEQKLILASVYEQLDRLPVNDRIAWTLRNVNGEKLEDVAAYCGVSLATAKRRIESAQQHLDRVFA